MTSEWETDRLDLAGYLSRVGRQAGPPNEATLDRLHRAHVATIPFENLDIILGHGVAIDLDSVQHKLVDARRGGYCHEHAVLFASVLERLGFTVERALARIGHNPDHPKPRTHMMLNVTGNDGHWLADVGFGAGLVAPIPWEDGLPAEQAGWTYRLRNVDTHGTRALQERRGNDWVSLYTFTTETVHASDVEMANHFTSTHPSSPFVGKPVAMRRQNRQRIRLRGRTLETITPDKSVKTKLPTCDALGRALATTFDLHLAAEDLHKLTPQTGPPQFGRTVPHVVEHQRNRAVARGGVR